MDRRIAIVGIIVGAAGLGCGSPGLTAQGVVEVDAMGSRTGFRLPNNTRVDSAPAGAIHGTCTIRQRVVDGTLVVSASASLDGPSAVTGSAIRTFSIDSASSSTSSVEIMLASGTFMTSSCAVTPSIGENSVRFRGDDCALTGTAGTIVADVDMLWTGCLLVRP